MGTRVLSSLRSWVDMLCRYSHRRWGSKVLGSSYGCVFFHAYVGGRVKDQYLSRRSVGGGSGRRRRRSCLLVLL